RTTAGLRPGRPPGPTGPGATRTTRHGAAHGQERRRRRRNRHRQAPRRRRAGGPGPRDARAGPADDDGVHGAPRRTRHLRGGGRGSHPDPGRPVAAGRVTLRSGGTGDASPDRAAGLLTGCSGEQEDGSTLKADPDLPFASFQRPADGSTLRYRDEVMAHDWGLHGSVTLRNGCVGLDYTNESGDQEFVTLGLPLPATWDAGTQTV